MEVDLHLIYDYIMNTHSHIMEFRKAHLDAFVKKYGIKLGFMSVFSKASAYALADQPVVNAVIDEGVSVFVVVWSTIICSLLVYILQALEADTCNIWFD